MKINAAFIVAATTHHTGGNCRADLLELKNGLALCLTDDSIAVYQSVRAFHDNDNEEAYRLLGGFTGCDRCETDVSKCGLTFVEAISTDEIDGPVSTDLVLLCDGCVLGVDAETIALYPSLDHFNRQSEEGTDECELSMGLIPDEPVWLDGEYDVLALAEGWLLSDEGWIERDDELAADQEEPWFPDDDAAVALVTSRANEGSLMHRAALIVHNYRNKEG